MFAYEVLLDALKFLDRATICRLQANCSWLRTMVEEHAMYWPLHKCYRLTFLEYWSRHTLIKATNRSEFPIEILTPIQLPDDLASISLADTVQLPLFFGQTEPSFFLFEFASGQKFFVQLDAFVNAENIAKFAFWMHQIGNVYFEEEIRGMGKFSPELLQWLRSNKLEHLLHLRCKTFGCYEYEPFDQLDIQFALNHLSVERLEKANGTIYSPELLQLLFQGAPTVKSFCTRWVMNCGPNFTDTLIQHTATSREPEKVVPCIRLTPSFHRQRELPMPSKSLTPCANVALVRQEFGDWCFQEWEVGNVHRQSVRFRVCIYIYSDPETDERAISQFSIERIA